MSEVKTKKVRIGKGERKVLKYLEQHPEGVWKDELQNKFSRSTDYYIIMGRRLKRMEEKGLIKIVPEINPETGRQKLRVYLNQ